MFFPPGETPEKKISLWKGLVLGIGFCVLDIMHKRLIHSSAITIWTHVAHVPLGAMRQALYPAMQPTDHPILFFLRVLIRMVYYFTSNVVDPPAFIYVGKDKVESMSTCNSGS